MKKQEIESVLHDWVSTLTFQQQALLMTGMRGPDGMPKECAAKPLVRYLRGVVLKPAGMWGGKNDNDFMWGDYEKFDAYAKALWKSHDDCPHHFLMHLIHCAQVLGYKHPSPMACEYWNLFYRSMCAAMHMHPETEEEMDKRLNDFK